tara:strand:- start:799 stop:1491 length:693 start_codon:yes stop_codon:yes gene_type:complete
MRSIIISGGSSGIGKSIVNRLLIDGHKLSLGVRDTDKSRLLFPNTKNLLFHKYDALDLKSTSKWINNSLDEFGEIDTVINCAGLFLKTPLLFDEGEISNIDKLWRINVMGPWNLCRLSWNNLIKSNNSRIITLVSMSGKRSKGNLAGYTASKFALMGICQTMRNEGWEYGIRVTAICPSWVNTPMAKDISKKDKKDMTQPEDIAELCSTLLNLPNSSVPFELDINCNLEK